MLCLGGGEIAYVFIDSNALRCMKKLGIFKVFLMLIDKTRDTEYSNIEKLNIYYNSVNITKKFNENSNKNVSDLNFTNDTPLVYINA